MEVWLLEKWRRGLTNGFENVGIFSSRKLAIDFCVEQGWTANDTHISPWVVDGKVPVKDD